MTVCNPGELKDLLAPGARLMGLDVGEKTVGIAFSDPGLVVASPRETIPRTTFGPVRDRLATLIREENVGALVIGLPVNMDGSEGPRCQSVRQFAANLLETLDLPLTFWDERLSTAAVERAMIAADLSRRRRAEKVDAAAAAYILQGLLDRLRAPDAGRGGVFG